MMGKKRCWRIVIWLATILALSLGLLGAYYRYITRSPAIPTNANAVLFKGITYIRDVRSYPRPLVIHLIFVDLKASGIKLLVTPANKTGKLPLRAQKTSSFCRAVEAQIAINGDFFTPWYSNSLWNYYPHIGDPVQVQGFAATQGRVYSHGFSTSPTLYLSQDNQASFTKPYTSIYNAISGNALLLKNGKVLRPPKWYSDHRDLQPRAALGLDKARRHLILAIVDGRQKGYSEGAALEEWARILREHGVVDALNLDGGGSATLVFEKQFRDVRCLNSPIDNHIPGRERPVANHLAIFALR
jgi:hypothetical protein